MKIINFLDEKIAHGKCTFTLDEAQISLERPRKQVALAIRNLRQKGQIASPAKGFYVIISPPYRKLGCIPASFFIPYLMDYWKENYYAGLLTAARYHQASHQSPQVFQVFLKTYREDITCGNVRIDFIVKHHLDIVPVQTIATEASYLKISTPEATAMDLIMYSKHAGGLNHSVTVLDELHKQMDETRLGDLLTSNSESPWKQRLGFILDYLEAHKLAKVIELNLKSQKRLEYQPLVPNINSSSVKKDVKWKIIINSEFESDLE